MCHYKFVKKETQRAYINLHVQERSKVTANQKLAIHITWMLALTFLLIDKVGEIREESIDTKELESILYPKKGIGKQKERKEEKKIWRERDTLLW